MTNSVAQHIAIIMDGNGRWAKAHGVERVSGHEQGASSVRSVVEVGVEVGISYITLYAFSSENWKRPKNEVDFLMDLLERFLYDEADDLNEKGVCLRVIGRRDRLQEKTLKAISYVEDLTRHNTKMTLFLAVDYGGRLDIMQASLKFAKHIQDHFNVMDLSSLKEEDVFSLSEDDFAKGLWGGEIPDPDLIIRTSGEYRLSNFLLWQSAYSELYITPKMWPDFTKEDFLEALDDLNKRERRYGAIKEVKE